jgi:hypothetical protein
MSVGTVGSIERTVQKTDEWLSQLADDLGTRLPPGPA